MMHVPLDEKEIIKLLMSLGFSVRSQGYLYAKEAVLILIENRKSSIKMEENVFLAVAKKYETKASSVMRAIRHNLESSRMTPNMKLLANELGINAGFSFYQPSVSEFIAILSEVMLLKAPTKIKSEN